MAIAFGLMCAALLSAGAAQAAGTWAYSGKTGIGTSYEDYPRADGAVATGPVSKVWFSVARGVVTETMFGLIHQAQLREMQFAVDVDGRTETEAADAVPAIRYLHTDAGGRPLSLAYAITSKAKSGRWEIEKHVFTDPDGDVLFVRARVRAIGAAVTPHLLLDPQMAGTSGGDRAEAGPQGLDAAEGDVHLAVRASRRFARAWAGTAGQPWQDTASTGASGDVELAGSFAPVAAGAEATYDIALGFGASRAGAQAQADASLKRGYAEVLARYNGVGAHVGWEDYLGQLTELPRLTAQTGDGGRLLYASALVLKAQEDKTHRGALIASLSNPWGDTVSAAQPHTGYKAVWPRDFYQVASAMLALGDRRTPVEALSYLQTVQAGPGTPGNKGAGGWFLQKTVVDGTPEWTSVQMDQTAMPILLAYKLARAGVVSPERLKALYGAMLKPAADFLAVGGTVEIGENKVAIAPPWSQQERWEEQPGYSPSTVAAVVAGLATAGDVAADAGDAGAAARYRAAADRVNGAIERTMFTRAGTFREAGGNGRYYLRVTENADPNDRGPLGARNGQQPLTEDQYLDAGFLELVRYGVRRADDPAILDSLPELDSLRLTEKLRVKYLFRFPGEAGEFPGWRRYGNDGYGEDAATGANYAAGQTEGGMSADQRGRVWPIFTGERGTYELARAALKPGGAAAADVAAIRGTYVRAMELFANEGLMIPEQVWEGVGTAPPGYVAGEGTNSATPLAWSHAEYVKLLRSLADGKVWDRYDNVAARYARER